MKFSIGEFSKMTSLSIKSLRLYHEKELLVPSEVDQFTGYRYYNETNYERAKSIRILKKFDFTLAEIKGILDDCDDESELLPQVENKLKEIEGKIHRYEDISRSIESIIQYERESTMSDNKEFEIEEKELETILIAGYRMKGKYQDIGKWISLLYKKLGRLITINEIRANLAKKHDATIGCPMTTGIFAWVAAHAADEEARKGKKDITPYWRTLKSGGVLNEKYPGGIDNIKFFLEREGHKVVQKGKKYVVENYEHSLVES